jgi:phenylacetate-coenzyme A ligase PaaK-like adenylate-forming protein
MTRRGTPAALDTMVSSAVRLCSYAKEKRIDISGTLLRMGGEPLTEPKARLIADVGCSTTCFYSITEMSFVGAPCATPTALDDVHVLTDKVAAIVRPKSVGATSVDALVYTTLLPSSPKLLINVESGDFAAVSTRNCGCPMGELGFHQHLSEIRSYEKLTSEGVTFLGTELLHLVEDVLPTAFGGTPTDYQLVETEENGISRILIVASPKLGPLDASVVVERIITTLNQYPGGSVMTQHWRQGDTLRLVRREPYQTASAKILPLHLHRLTVATESLERRKGESVNQR